MSGAVQGYTAAGGVVVHGDNVLVLYRPMRGEYRLPKGHVKAGESLEEAALREVTEETGFTNLRIAGSLGGMVVHLQGGGVRVERYFLMTLTDGRTTPATAGEAQYQPLWISRSDAPATLTFDVEREWVRRAGRLLGEPG